MVKRNKNRGFIQNKKEIFNTKLKTGCFKEKRRHKKSMPSRLKRHKKREKFEEKYQMILSNKLVKVLSFKFDSFNDCVFIWLLKNVS